MGKASKIGKFLCEHCGATSWIEAKYELTRCEYCNVPFLVKYRISDIVFATPQEIDKLKEKKVFYDIPDTSECSDKYNVTFFNCNNCKKGHLIDPSNELIICDFCDEVYKAEEILSNEDKKYAEEIKRLKSQSHEITSSNSIRNIKQAQRIEKQSHISVPKSEDDKSKGLFSKLFKK